MGSAAKNFCASYPAMLSQKPLKLEAKQNSAATKSITICTIPVFRRSEIKLSPNARNIKMGGMHVVNMGCLLSTLALELEFFCAKIIPPFM